MNMKWLWVGFLVVVFCKIACYIREMVLGLFVIVHVVSWHIESAKCINMCNCALLQWDFWHLFIYVTTNSTYFC